jgi:repressor LexA
VNLQSFKNWMKIQLLDIKTAQTPAYPCRLGNTVRRPVVIQGATVMSTLDNFSHFPSEGPKLTARQQQILELIQSAIARTGAPPTRAEIATELGFRSANAAEEHLQALARKGVIELVSGTSRGIRLRSDALRTLNESRTKQFSLPLQSLAQLALPLVGRVAAGSPILAQEHIEQTYYFESSLFQRQPDYLLKVRGMSMRDVGIMDGDLRAVKQAKEAKNGQIVVARLGDEVTVKRFRRNKHLIELLPENPDFKTIVVEPGEPFELEGLAVGLIRNTMLM